MLFKSDEIMIGEHIPEDSECLHAPPYRVRGCVLSIIERLDEEFIKMLQVLLLLACILEISMPIDIR